MDYQIFFKVATEHLRPTIPTNCHPIFSNIIKKCLDANSSNRPTTKQLLDELFQLKKSSTS